MTIVSVSLNNDNLEALDSIQAAYGLNGRSEAVRASINAALKDIRELESLDGDVEGVLIIVRGDPWMMRIQGTYAPHIKTQLHSHLKNHKCLEVMVLSCDGDVLSRMLRDIQSEGKADYVKFVRG